MSPMKVALFRMTRGKVECPQTIFPNLDYSSPGGPQLVGHSQLPGRGLLATGAWENRAPRCTKTGHGGGAMECKNRAGPSAVPFASRPCSQPRLCTCVKCFPPSLSLRPASQQKLGTSVLVPVVLPSVINNALEG